MLEARENPSYYWDPVTSSDLSSSNPVNWVKDSSGSMVRCSAPEVPTSPVDELVFGAYIPQTYRYGGPPIPAHWATADCVLTQASQYTTNGVANFRGFKVLDTYTGEVDLRQSATVQSLKMFGGRIKQDDPTAPSGTAGTLSVGTTLTWTKGTINSNTIPGILNLNPGAVGTIDPDDNVSLGSTLNLLGNVTTSIGSNLDMHDGLYHILRGDGIIAQNRSSLIMAPIPKNSKSETVITIKDERVTPTDGLVKVEKGASCMVDTVKRANDFKGSFAVEFTGKDPEFKNYGNVDILHGAQLHFIPDGTGTEVSNGYFQGLEETAFTKIEAGCKIICEKNAIVGVYGGKFGLTESKATDGSISAVQLPISIIFKNADAPFVSISKDAILGRGDAIPTTPLILKIEGDPKAALFMGGKWETFAKRSLNLNDSIFTEGYVECKNTAKLQFKWFANDSGPLRAINETWTLIESTFTGFGDAINAPIPFDPDSLPVLDNGQSLSPGLCGLKNEFFKVKRLT